MAGRIWRYIKKGWELIKDLHEISWLLSALGLGIPASLPAWLAWGHPVNAGLLVGSAIVLWAILFLCLLGYYGYREEKKAAVPTPSRPAPSQSTTLPEYISIAEAATRLYESPAHLNGVRLSVAAEKLGSLEGATSPNERLDFLATFISQKIAVYGCKSPARTVKKIDDQDIRGAKFTDGATVLRDNFYDKSIFWVDLCVRSEDFTWLVASLSGGEPDPFVPIHLAIKHVAAAIGDRNTDQHDPCFPDTRTALRQAAVLGKLRMRGHRQVHGPSDFQSFFDDIQTDIPSDYWRTAVIGPTAIDPNYSRAGHTMPKVANDWGSDWTKAKKQIANLHLNRDDLFKLWPKTN